MRSNDYGAASLGRALDLLFAILGEDGERSLGLIAQDLEMPVSTAHRFVSALVSHGLIRRTGRGRYRITYRLARHGGSVPEHRAIASAARAPLKALAADTGATVHLGVLDGDMVTYLVKESGKSPLFTREGMQLEAYCSAIGKLLLAQASRTYLDNGPFVRLTSATIVEPEAIRRHLEGVRCQNYAVDDREIEEELGCLAVPVRAPHGPVVAAISWSSSPPTPVTGDALERLNACAHAIERAIA